MVTSVFGDLASQAMISLPSRRGLIAVSGEAEEEMEAVADRLVEALRLQGTESAAHSVVEDESMSVERVLNALLSQPQSEEILVVFGAGLLSPAVRTRFHWTLWLERSATRRTDRDAVTADAFRRFRDIDEPRAAASAILDVSDPSSPRRDWNDACSV